MLKRILPVLLLACGAEATAPSECACGSDLTSESAERAPYDTKLAEFVGFSCQIAGGAFRGECADGKVFLHRGGGFGHQTLYYRDGRLVGMSQSSDILFEDCPLHSYQGSLADVTCQRTGLEQLCTSATDLEREPPLIPFADGELSPWCDEFVFAVDRSP